MSLPPVIVPSPIERQVAIVTADRALAQQLERECRRLGHRTALARSLAALEDVSPLAVTDVLLLDSLALGSSGRESLADVAGHDDAPTVILVAPPGDPAPAYDLLAHGVADVVHRSCHPYEVRLRVSRALEARDVGVHLATLEDAISERSRRSFSDRSLVANSDAMRALSEMIGRVAPMRTTVLILGETGVGKELVARAIHFRSTREGGPFIPINCAALPPHLIESELFGHERGAFTGAVSRRAGKFELGHRGTLFLDEIGETDLTTQAKLLRALEHQEFMRIGGSRPVKVDVRLIAATNADLERLVREGRFREDLYYRLKVCTLTVPPLRERREDIPELVNVFLNQICRENHLRPRHLSPTAEQALGRYPWPGNVRELLNTLEGVVVSTATETIDLAHLPASVQGSVAAAVPVKPRHFAGLRLRDLEAEAVRQALVAAQGSRTRAAAQLGIGVRTLRRRIQELGLDAQLPPRPGRPRRA